MTGSVSSSREPLSRRTRAFALAIVVLGVLNHAPSLAWGFLYDDFMHQFFLRSGDKPWSLYEFTSAADPNDALVERGLLPWWTSPDFRIRYFRPVASATLLADSLLYGGWAPGYHVTSVVLFGVFLLVAFELYAALGLSSRAALWALSFLALDDVHALPVGWIAARATLVAALFITATVLAFLRFQRRGSPIDLGASLLLFLCACASKEDSAIVVPILALVLLAVNRPPEGESLANGVHRVLRSKALWAFALVAAGWVVLYARAGYGTNSALHITPWEEPLQFATRLASMIPLNLTTLFFGLPGGDLLFTRPGLAVYLVPLGILAASFLALVLFRHARPRPLAALALGWTFLALAPASVVATSDRVLSIAAVGSAMALGLVLDDLGPLRRLRASRQYRRLGLWALFVAAGIVASVPALHVRGAMFSSMAARDRDAIERVELGGAGAPHRRVLVVNTPSSLLSLFIPLTATVLHDDPSLRMYPLQIGRRSMTWRRESEREIVVTFGPPLFLDHRFELLFRTGRTGRTGRNGRNGDAVPRPGESFETPAFSATILETDDEGVLSVRFRSRESFDDPSYLFLVWEGGAFRPVSPPLPGEGVVSLGEPAPIVPWAP